MDSSSIWNHEKSCSLAFEMMKVIENVHWDMSPSLLLSPIEIHKQISIGPSVDANI